MLILVSGIFVLLVHCLSDIKQLLKDIKELLEEGGIE